MKIAITGSSGLIGKELSRELAASGHHIVALVRNQHDAIDEAHCWWQPDQGIREPEKLAGIEAVIHLAGRGIADRRWTQKEKLLIRQSRVEATKRLCEDLVQLEQAPSVFLSASAVGIYGDCHDEVVTEQHPAGAGFLAETAVDWEAAAIPIVSAGARVLHARFGIVLSRKGGALAKMLPIFRWGLGGNLGNGQQYWSWITLQDTVRALNWMLGEPTAGGAYNVVAPAPVTNAQFTQELARAVHRWKFLPVPRQAVRCLFGEMADNALLASCRAVPERLMAANFEFTAPSLTRAWRHLL